MRSLLLLPLGVLFLNLIPSCSTSTRDQPAEDAGQTSDARTKDCGRVGALCSGNEWCAYDSAGSCGDLGLAGSCLPRPSTCDSTCAGVCGCDGKVYCNACTAHQVGADVASGTACFPAGVLTSFQLPGDGRRVIFKRDDARNFCAEIFLTKPAPSPSTFPQLTVNESYGVDHAILTNNASDCVLTSAGEPRIPQGQTVTANAGQGTVTFTTVSCKVSSNFRIGFYRVDQVWAPDAEPVVGDAIDVNGCN